MWNVRVLRYYLTTNNTNLFPLPYSMPSGNEMFEEGQIEILKVISVVTYLFFTVYTVITVMYLYKIRKKTSLNSNLRLQLGHIAVPMWFMMVMEASHTTIFLLNGYVYPLYTPAWWFLDISLMIFLGHLMAQIAERVFATVLVAKYEEIGSKFPTIALAIILIQWIYGVFCFMVMISHVFKYVTVFQFAFEFVITTTVYIVLPRISQKMYQQYKHSENTIKDRTHSTTSLGLRYQTSENLKAANLTAKIIRVQIVTSLMAFALHAYGKNTTQNSFEWLIVMKVIHVTLCLSAMIQQAIVLYELRSKVSSTTSSDVVQHQNARLQQEMYFQQLEDQWNKINI